MVTADQELKTSSAQCFCKGHREAEGYTCLMGKWTARTSMKIKPRKWGRVFQFSVVERFWNYTELSKRLLKTLSAIAIVLGWSQRWKERAYCWRHRVLQKQSPEAPESELIWKPPMVWGGTRQDSKRREATNGPTQIWHLCTSTINKHGMTSLTWH